MQDFLKSIGIEEQTKEVNGELVLELNDSNEFQDLFEYLQGVDEIELDEDSVEFTDTHNKATFKGDKYNVVLNADFENEKYELVVKNK